MKKTKKPRKYSNGSTIEPLQPLPTLQPRLQSPTTPPSSLSQYAVQTQTRTYEPVQGGAASNFNMQAPDLSQLQIQASPMITDRQSAAASIQTSAANTTSALNAIGSINPMLGAFTGLISAGISGNAASKAARLQEAKLGWSPGQSQAETDYYKNFNSGGDLYLPPAVPRDTIAPKMLARGIMPRYDIATGTVDYTPQPPPMTAYDYEKEAKIKAYRLRNPDWRIKAQTTYEQQQGAVSPTTHGGFQSSGKSKSRDRYREYAAGGSLTAAKAAEILHDGSVHGHPLTDKQRRFFAAKAYADGGDIALNSQTFQVQGNPNVYDSEEYQTPSGPIKLDHNEVVKQSFAYSNRLKNPLTNNTFAKDAAIVEKSTGKAEKKLKLNPQDTFSQNTIKYNDVQSSFLAELQELVATAKGKRNPDGSTKQAYNTGGPVEPDANRPYMSIGGDYFYDPYDKRFLFRNPWTGSYSIEDNPGFGTGKGFRPYATVEGDELVVPPATTQSGETKRYSISKHLREYPPAQTLPINWEQHLTGQEGTTRLPEVTISSRRPTGTPGGKAAPKPVSTDRPMYLPPGVGGHPSAPDNSMVTLPDGSQIPAELNGPLSSYQSPSLEERLGHVESPTFDFGSIPPFETPSNEEVQPLVQADKKGYGPKIGDILQAAEVISKFAQLRGGAEVERPYFDTTPVTRETFDVDPILAQNQRNYQLQVNSYDTPSPTLRRALQNQAYAQKLNADYQAVDRYQQLNNQARTQYEGRLSNRQRYNIGQRVYTNDINARNRGQYQNAVQNAFTSLGNFGEAMNAQAQAYDALNILKNMYPDVYGRVLEESTKKSKDGK